MILAQTDPMRFVVRYWSSLLPAAGIGPDTPHWIDYSVHPATRLGLHNALLVVHDRLDILGAHGGKFECAVFVVDGERCERLLPEVAEALFPHLAPGEVKWIDIHEFHLPEVPVGERTAPAEPVPQEADPPPHEQLPLFPHIHTPYDDLEGPAHTLDVKI